MLRCFFQRKGKLDELKPSEAFAGCWLDAMEPSEDDIRVLSEISGVPLLHLKAALDKDERPRVEEERNWSGIIYRAPFVHRSGNEVHYETETAPIGIFVTQKFVITVHLKHYRYIDQLLERMKAGEPLLKTTSGFVIKLLEAIGARYYELLKKIEQDVNGIETAVTRAEMHKLSLERISDTKRALVYFHRALIANRFVLEAAVDKGIHYVEPRALRTFKDLKNDLTQLTEMSLTYKDILDSSLNVYEFASSKSSNDVVKVLTVVAAVLILPTVITGLYGMNVQLPLADSPNAFWMVLGIALFAVLLTLKAFKKKHWI